MRDEEKSREQLLSDLTSLRRRVVQLEEERAHLKRVKEDAEESTLHHCLALETARMGTWNWNLISGKHTWSEIHEAMWGYAPGTFPGTTEAALERVHPDDLPGLLEAGEEAKKTGNSIQCEFRVIWPDGSLRWVTTNGRYLFDTRRQPIRAVGVAFDITERKRAEQALADEAVRRRILVEQSRDGIVVLDQNGKVYEANLRYAEMLGYTPEEMLQLHVWDWDTQYTREQILNMARSVDATGDHFETRHRRKDGSVLDVEVSTNGAVCCGQKLIFCVCRDITERKRAEERLIKSERRFRSILDQAADDIIVHDLQGRILDVNQQNCRSLGYLKEELLAMNVSELDLEAIGSGKDQLWKSIAEGQRFTFESRVRRKDGSTFPVEISLGPIEIEDETLVLGIARNITERKQAEQELRDSEARFKALHNASFGGIAIHDKGIILECNQGLSEISGYSVAELIGMDGLLLIAEQSRTTVMQNILTGYEKPYEVMGLRKDGTEFPVRLEARNIPYKGKLVRSAEIRDITELKRGEEEREMLRAQLNQVQKLESVGRLAGGVAHDFNNMLGVILGHAELAMARIEPSHALFPDLTEIKKAAERSADLTRQLLAFARRQTISPKILNLNETVEGMLKMLRRLIGEDMVLAWLPAQGLWPVKVDPSQIDQILANLCVNARDAISGVGKVTIETGNTSFDKDYCARHPEFVPGEFVMLAISDDGCGMDKETQDRIFEPFYTTKGVGEGTGLGLSTVYGIVKQNHGFINIYSEPGQGTTFKIYFPRAEGQETEKPPSLEKRDLRGKETVLLVEDEESILALGKTILERHGYEVLAAKSPNEALRMIQSHSGPIHLLITDVVMPEMNGKDLRDKVAELRPDLKRIFMSGYTAKVIAHHGILDEGIDFLQKPFSVKTLLEKVRDALDR